MVSPYNCVSPSDENVEDVWSFALRCANQVVLHPAGIAVWMSVNSCIQPEHLLLTMKRLNLFQKVSVLGGIKDPGI